jgi:hypothetical protein
MFARVFQVLFLKDINLPRPDKYDTCALIAFLQQLVTFKGFYDEHLEFLGIERVHIVCTMNPATTVGRHPLSTRYARSEQWSFLCMCIPLWPKPTHYWALWRARGSHPCA